MARQAISFEQQALRRAINASEDPGWFHRHRFGVVKAFPALVVVGLVRHNLVNHVTCVVASQYNLEIIVVEAVDFWTERAVIVAFKLCFSRRLEAMAYVYLIFVGTPRRASIRFFHFLLIKEYEPFFAGKERMKNDHFFNDPAKNIGWGS